MKRILIALIILSAVFIFKGLEKPCYDAQFAVLILSVFVLGGYLLYKENKWLGFMAWLYGVSFFKTFLYTPNEYLFKECIGAIALFGIYYAVKKMSLEKDILKWFLIPIALNCIVLLIQLFDNSLLFPKGIHAGLIGNIGLVGCYLAMGLPLVFNYNKKMVLPYVILIILTRSLTAMAASLVIIMFYFYHMDKKLWRIGIMIIMLVMILFLVNSVIFEQGVVTIKEDAMYRACMWTATIHSISYHPITGWGIGRFIPIMKSIPESKSEYLGRYFNERDYRSKDPNKLKSFMDHPHNEVLYNVWMMGVGFLVVFIGLFIDLKRKFTVNNLLPFSILLGGFIIMIGHFMSSPAWFMLFITLAVYETEVCHGKTEKGRKKG